MSNVRYRLTLLGPAREGRFESDVVLSRSRFLAPATHSLRFYREYFKPARERFIQKDRRRWRVLFRGTEFYLNLDRVEQPDLGYFIEAKSRTWSRRDAEHKAELARELIACLGAAPADAVAEDYVEIADGSPASGGMRGFWAIRCTVMRYKTSFGCPASNVMTVLDVPNALIGLAMLRTSL